MKLSITASIAALALLSLTSSAPAKADKTEAQLLKEAKVSRAVAEQTALHKVPNGKIKEAELEKEHGKLVWSFDIATPKSENITEVQVDAKTGRIVRTEIETPTDKATEAAQDKREGKR